MELILFSSRLTGHGMVNRYILFAWFTTISDFMYILSALNYKYVFFVGDKGSLPGVLKTANFGGDAETSFNDLLAFQPDKPVMCMEFWCGWFDHWFENHSTTTADGKWNTYTKHKKMLIFVTD